jgi:hypothetical protein
MPWKTPTMITDGARFVLEAERSFLPFADPWWRDGIIHPIGYKWLGAAQRSERVPEASPETSKV